MLSNTRIKALKPKSTPYRVWDSKGDGLGIQVAPGGGKAFFQFYTVPAGYGSKVKRRFMPLGKFPAMTLDNAREQVRGNRELLAQGIDPQAQRKADQQAREKMEVENRRKGTVRQLFDCYIAELKTTRRPATSELVARLFERDAIPVLGADTKARDVTPDQIKLCLHRVIKRGAMVQANRLHSYLRRAFVIGLEHDNDPKNIKAEILFGLERNPARDVPKPMKKEAPRMRALDWWEIAAIFKALDRCPLYPETIHLLKLSYLAGGQRFEELRGAPWSEFNFDAGRWDIPAPRTKNNRAHLVPLVPEAVAELKKLKQLTGHSKYLFPKLGDIKAVMPGETPSQAARSLQRFMAKEHEQNPDKYPLLEPWQPRDCRGTVKTRLGELKISREIRNQLQNHATTSDVAGKFYDRFDYFEEKTRALQAFVKRLCAEIDGKKIPSNVVSIK
jgi:integrase